MKAPIKDMKLELYPKGDVTQWFGENPALYARFSLLGHNGIDLVRAHGTPMYAIEDGTIVDVNNDPSGFGKHVRLLSDDEEDNEYNLWVYGHCADIFVKVGDKVKEGDMIATMGNTGFVVSGSTPFWKNNPYAGTHLHLGLRKVKRPRKNGWSYEGSDIRIDVVNYGNGYKGSIDPRSLLESMGSVQKDSIRELQLTLLSLAQEAVRLLLKIKNNKYGK